MSLWLRNCILFFKVLPENVPATSQKAFRVAFALLFLSQTLTGCGQRGKSEDEVLMESLGRERARMESLLVVGKDKLLEAGLKKSLDDDLDYLLTGHYQPQDELPIKEQIFSKSSDGNNITPQDLKGDIHEIYPKLVARIGLQKVIQSLYQWTLFTKSTTISSALNQNIRLYEESVFYGIGEPEMVTPLSVIKNNYPSLMGIIETYERQTVSIDSNQVLGAAAESIINVSRQFSTIEKRLEELVYQAALIQKNNKIHLANFKEAEVQMRKLSPELYSLLKKMDHEEDPNTRSLIRTKIENIRQSLGADYEAIADRMLQIRELNIEPDKKRLEELGKQTASLIQAQSQLLASQNFLVALTLEVPYEIDGKQTEVSFYKVIDDIFASPIKFEDRYRTAFDFAVNFLKNNTEGQIKRILQYTATIVEGHRLTIAPLIPLRASALEYLKERYPRIANENLFHEDDNELSMNYGFDLYGKRFADINFSDEIASTFLVAVGAASFGTHYKVQAREINKIKNPLERKAALEKYIIDHTHTGSSPKQLVKRAYGSMARYLVKEIYEYDRYVSFYQKTGERFDANHQRHLRKGIHDNIKVFNGGWRGLGKKLGRWASHGSRLLPLWGMIGLVDAAAVGLMHYQGKNMFDFAKKHIIDGVYAGGLPYHYGVKTGGVSEFDLYVRLGAMTITALVTSYFFIWGWAPGVRQSAIAAINNIKNSNSGWLSGMASFMVGRLGAAKKSFMQVWDSLVSNPETLFRGFTNALSTSLMVTIAETRIRGFDHTTWVPPIFSAYYWQDALEMYSDTSSGALLNLLSFVLIDFFMIFSFEESKLMSIASMKVYMLGFLGVLFALWGEMFLKDSDVTSMKHDRLVLEGSYLATISTWKYTFLVGPILIWTQRGWVRFRKIKSTQMYDQKSLLEKSSWMGIYFTVFVASNFLGNVPFQLLVYQQENSVKDQLDSKEVLHQLGEATIVNLDRSLYQGKGELNSNNAKEIRDGLRQFNDDFENWLQTSSNNGCSGKNASPDSWTIFNGTCH